MLKKMRLGGWNFRCWRSTGFVSYPFFGVQSFGFAKDNSEVCVAINFPFFVNAIEIWWLLQLATLGYYCWWLKSCTTWDVKNPVNNRINCQPQLVSRISSINSIAKPFSGIKTEFGSVAFFFPENQHTSWLEPAYMDRSCTAGITKYHPTGNLKHLLFCLNVFCYVFVTKGLMNIRMI